MPRREDAKKYKGGSRKEKEGAKRAKNIRPLRHLEKIIATNDIAH